MTISCPGTEKIRHVRVVGMFTAEKTCRINSEYLHLSIPQQVQSNTVANPFKSSSARYFALSPNTTLTLTNRTKQNHLYNDLRLELREIQKGLSTNMTKIQREEHLIISSSTQIGLSIGNMLGVAIILLAILTLSWLICSKRAKEKTNQQQTVRMSSLKGGTL